MTLWAWGRMGCFFLVSGGGGGGGWAVEPGTNVWRAVGGHQEPHTGLGSAGVPPGGTTTFATLVAVLPGETVARAWRFLPKGPPPSGGTVGKRS